MIKHEEYIKMKGEKARCPYGRKTDVGDVRCVNCMFNKIGVQMCMGDAESVKKHQKKLGLDY